MGICHDFYLRNTEFEKGKKRKEKKSKKERNYEIKNKRQNQFVSCGGPIRYLSLLVLETGDHCPPLLRKCWMTQKTSL